MTDVLEVKNIYKKHDEKHTEVIALKELSFTVQPGEFVTVTGLSGLGKNTFLTIAAGLQASASGRVIVGEQSLGKLMKKQRLVRRFQEAGFTLQSSSLVPFLTVEDQFHLIEKVDKPRKNSELKEQSLETLGLEEPRSSYSRDLSGGGRQRIAIACALYHEPNVILADEPTASLDTEKVSDVVQLLTKEAKEKDKGIIMVTHDERLLEYCDRVVRTCDGKLTE